MYIVSKTLELVTTIVESTAATNAAKVAQAISPTFFAAITLYVIYLIYEITYAQRDVLMNEVTKNIGALALLARSLIQRLITASLLFLLSCTQVPTFLLLLLVVQELQPLLITYALIGRV